MKKRIISVTMIALLSATSQAQQTTVATPTAVVVSADVTPASVAAKYIDAIGGASAVTKIVTVTTKATARVQGMDLAMIMINAKGGKMLMDVQLGGNSLQKIVFDGTSGYMAAQGQKHPMNLDMIKKMTMNSEVFPELNFAKSGNMKVVGIEKYNDEDSYVVKGNDATYYYSVKTGLKTGEIKTEGGQTVPSSFSDYKSVAGVMMPFKITQNMGGMDIDVIVESIVVNQAKDEDFK